MKDKKSYYAIIPADVRYSDIPDGAKLLYGEITALSNQEGYCWATNSYFSELYGKTNKTISRWVKALQNAGFIHCEIELNNARKIYLIGVGRKCLEGGTKMSIGWDKNVHRVGQKCLHNTTSNNTVNNTSNTDQAEPS